MDINIYYIGYVTKKLEYNVNSVNLLYLLINELLMKKMVIST